MNAPPPRRVLGFAGFRRTVSDLRRSVAFYCQGLGFELEASRPGVIAGAAATVRLRLGEQSLTLIENATLEVSTRYAEGHIDVGFQHIAIVAADIAAALARLHSCAFVAISRGSPVQLPAESGGAAAYKFLDPDGHPLELIEFPAGTGEPEWQRHRTGRVTLGIDHSAIVTSDTARSIQFYRDALGFSVSARQYNHGPAQALLDGLDGAAADVVALRPTREATPHLELLGYRADLLRPPMIGSPTDRLLWWCEASTGDESKDIEVSDPDGHRHVLIAAPRD